MWDALTLTGDVAVLIVAMFMMVVAWKSLARQREQQAWERDRLESLQAQIYGHNHRLARLETKVFLGRDLEDV